jgi:hypothetical protein
MRASSVNYKARRLTICVTIVRKRGSYGVKLHAKKMGEPSTNCALGLEGLLAVIIRSGDRFHSQSP